MEDYATMSRLVNWSWSLGYFSATCVSLFIISFLLHRWRFKDKDGKEKSMLTTLNEWSIFLIGGGLLAQIWVHATPEIYEAFKSTELFKFPFVHHTITAKFLINEGPIMTGFFGLAAAELTEAALLPGGSLYKENFILPFGATIGGVLGPIGVYLILCTPGMRAAFPVPCATDIAFAWMGATALFGPKHPGTIFLLAVAVIDDFIGMAMIAVFIPQGHMNFFGLLLIVLAMVSAWQIRKAGKKYALFTKWQFYFLVSGTLSWYGLHIAGLHPALALVFVVPFMPLAKSHAVMFEEHDHEGPETIERFKHAWEVPINISLALFSLVNAGVLWIGAENIWTQDSNATFYALIIGKTLGITSFAYFTYRLIKLFKSDYQLPSNEYGELNFTIIFILSNFAAIGFTVALFVIDAGKWGDDLKVAALASLICLPLGVILGKFLLRFQKPLKKSQEANAQ